MDPMVAAMNKLEPNKPKKASVGMGSLSIDQMKNPNFLETSLRAQTNPQFQGFGSFRSN